MGLALDHGWIRPEVRRTTGDVALPSRARIRARRRVGSLEETAQPRSLGALSDRLTNMADDDRNQDGPSLEAPALGFWRKRRKKAAPGTPEPETTSALPADDAPATKPEPDPEGAPPLFADELEAAPAVITEDLDETTQGQPTVEKSSRAPLIGGLAAVVVTGLLIGAIMVGLTAGSLQLCESVKGTSSCGNPGFLLLVAIVIMMVLLGSALLRACRVADPGSTSFLAVGLLAVLALLFLVDVLANWWMIIVIPVLSALTFVLSHWVTTKLVAPADH